MTRAVAVAPVSTAAPRLLFLDNIRYLMILFVLVYHSVAAYATVAPWWIVHDATFPPADVIRELLDTFMMPVLFFVSGYFALVSLKKKGGWSYLRDKARRLLIPYSLAVFVVQPLLLYDQPNQLVKPFWEYWVSYMTSFPVTLAYVPQTLAQGPYWFISLLFTFFVIVAAVYPVTRRWSGRTLSRVWNATVGRSPLATLAFLGLLTSVGYFVALLIMPDTSWLTLSGFLEFQPTRLLLFGAYFGFGMYAQVHGWFASEMPLGRVALWGAASAVLALAYIAMSLPLYPITSEAQSVSISLLLTFAFVRSFLTVALLVTLLSFGLSYWNRPNRLDAQLSKTSYNIYLSHVWFVAILQTALLVWVGSVLAKFIIVLLLTFGLSYAVSRWVIGRYPRGTAAALVGLLVFCLAVRP